MAVSRFTSVFRGFCERCPKCGAGRLFGRYLKQVSNCSVCGEAYGQYRADDFPPYLTILVVGHIVIPLVLVSEMAGMSTLLQEMLWLPATLLLTLLLLPRMKGAVLGHMWSLGLKGDELQ